MEEEKAEEKSDFTQLSVLIAEDVKTMRTIFRKTLKSLNIGQVLHMAENGLEALKILNTVKIDLAIVDWKMPVMNGYELIEFIRNDRQHRDMPILMVTAESEKELVLEVAEIEVDGYLLKPITPASLEEKIRAVMHHARYPEKADLHIRRARDLAEEGDLTMAIKHMKKASEMRPKASRVLRNLGLLYEKAGDGEQKLTCLESAVRVNPEDVVSRKLLGDCHWQAKDLPAAGRCYLEVASGTRKFSEQAIRLSRDLFAGNLDNLAMDILKTVLSHSPRSRQLVEEVADLCLENDQIDYALTLLTGLVHDFPAEFDYVFKAGRACEALGDIDTAISHFSLVEQKEPDRIDVKLRLAACYLAREKVIQADDYVNQVLKIDPDNPEARALRQQL